MVNAADAVFAIAWMSVFGLPFLIAALDGHGTHVATAHHVLSPKKRWVALVGANFLILAPLISCLVVKGVDPIEWFQATRVIWNYEGIWILGKAAATANWIFMVSPLITVAAVLTIRKAALDERQLEIVNAVHR